LPLLGQILTSSIAQDKEEHSNLSIILSFFKHVGEEYAGLTSRRILLLAKKYEKQHNVRNLVRDYHQTVCKHLRQENKDLQAAERSKRKAMESRGEISDGKREQLELMTSNYEKLFQSTQTLSDLFNENMSELPREVDVPSEGNVIEMIEEGDVQLDPWGDDDTKSFYVDLPDLRQFLPNYHGRKEPSEPLPEVEKVTEEAEEVEKELPEAEEKPAAPIPEKTQILGKTQLDSFLANLPNCVNRELIDSAVIDFLLNFNNKPNRKRLVKALFNVHRTRLDLLPLLARFCAIINLVSPDVALELSSMLRVDFKFHVKKRGTSEKW
jgi:regulator of nonsense transcripts 2